MRIHKCFARHLPFAPNDRNGLISLKKAELLAV
jgi:hypothetical protein